MPKFQKSIADTDQTVWRPMIVGMLAEIKEFTDLWKETTHFFPGESGKTFQAGSSLDAESISDTVRGETYSILDIEASEEYEHDGFLSTPVEHPEHLFIFRDDSLGISLKPAYSSCDVTIAIKYRGWDKNSVEQWKQQLKMRVARGRLVNMHTITYGYIIPESQMYILHELWRMREAVDGYGQSFDEYFKEKVSGHATLATNLAGKNQVWMMGESTNRIQGYFDFDGAPEKGQKADGNETWTIAVNYKFRYYRPEVCWMEYPLMIHNQLVGQDFRPAHGPYQIEEQERAYQWSTKAFSHFEKGVPAQTLNHHKLGLRLPAIDEWLSTYAIPYTYPMATILLSLDPANPRVIADLKADLYPYKLDPDVQSFLASEAPYIAQPYNSIFQFSIYEFDQQRDVSWLAMDSNLIVSLTVDPSLRKFYHLRIGLVTNLDLLSAGAKKRLQSHCTAALKLFDTIDPTLKLRGKMPVCIQPGDWLPSSGLEGAGGALTKPILGAVPGNGWGTMRTVEQATINVYRKATDIPKKR